MFKKILLATDGSEHSIRSARSAIELAKKFDGMIDVVYVVNGETSKSDVLHYGNDLTLAEKRNERIKPVLDLLVESAVQYKVKILHGEPGPTIIKLANEQDYDCVVLGSRELNNFQTFILGSVSHKVAKRAECPVLIVK
ncbi:universal stress protein [Brevibacillus sp. SYSU BS000544]|uniref:universal stress protein n=1 Tax=Brevibacillus sp. SYSU BS000544 TaxID=3416443 RepID=UPI003CE5743E